MSLLVYGKDACFHLYDLQVSQTPFTSCPPGRAEGLAGPLSSPTADTLPPVQLQSRLLWFLIMCGFYHALDGLPAVSAWVRKG